MSPRTFVSSALLQGQFACLGSSSAYGALGRGGSAAPGLVFDYAGGSTCTSSWDWVIPGSPFEGWSLSYVNSGGARVLLTNENSGSASLTGGTLWVASGVDFACSRFDRRLVWEGANADVRVTHDMRFNDGDRFVAITTTVTARQTVSDVKFARFIDPDVDWAVHG